MSPQEIELAAQRTGFTLDSAQLAVTGRLCRIGTDLSRRRGPFGRAPRGVYLWGPVGRGKSWLANAVFDAVPVDRKRRFHFHEFFREFHAAYSRHLRERRASDLAVAELLGDCRFLYFDEFHVHDPGDAMLIGRVLTSLFDRKTTLLTTSNYPPAGLLPNPLHHHLFEPTITVLEQTMDIIELDGPQDYRTVNGSNAPRSSFERGMYVRPGTEQQLAALGLPPQDEPGRRWLQIGSRGVSALAVRDGLVRFDFADLCDRPTSTVDFLALADRFPTWVVSGLPLLGSTNRDAAQRFANLVDVLCDRDVELFLVGAHPLDEVLRGENLPADVNRTASRLSLLSTVTEDGDVEEHCL